MKKKVLVVFLVVFAAVLIFNPGELLGTLHNRLEILIGVGMGIVGILLLHLFSPKSKAAEKVVEEFKLFNVDFHPTSSSRCEMRLCGKMSNEAFANLGGVKNHKTKKRRKFLAKLLKEVRGIKIINIQPGVISVKKKKGYTWDTIIYPTETLAAKHFGIV